MAEDSSSQKIDLNSVAAIVRSYVAKNSVAVDQLGALIAMVHRTLSGLGENAPGALPDPLTPAVPIRRSVQPDHVVCLECGFRAVTLRRHLRVAHGLEPAAYRVRWKLATRSRADSTGLFGAPLDDGKTAWAWPQAGRS
jgi:predicted transcriptional regulator